MKPDDDEMETNVKMKDCLNPAWRRNLATTFLEMMVRDNPTACVETPEKLAKAAAKLVEELAKGLEKSANPGHEY